MKIAFDAKRLFYNHTGLGNYSRSLVRNIELIDKSNDISLFTPTIEKSVYSEFISDKYNLCLGKKKFLWRLKNMVKDLHKLNPDIYHGLSNELPVGINSLQNTKSIVTIHDLVFLKYPDYYPLSDRIIYKEKSKRACKKADHIIAISEATKEDIVNYFDIEESKITVVYQACSEIYYSNDASTIPSEDERPFFMFVSSITERKNLQLVLRALARIAKVDRPLLKVVGKGAKHENAMKALAQKLGISEDVEFQGRVDDVNLRSLYKQAMFTIYPSLYEGFGIPIVESMLMGTPVITSNISSMPEAAAGVAELIDPNSVEDLEKAINKQLDQGGKLSQDQIQLIRDKFNPQKHAMDVLALYDRVQNKR